MSAGHSHGGHEMHMAHAGSDEDMAGMSQSGDCDPSTVTCDCGVCVPVAALPEPGPLSGRLSCPPTPHRLAAYTEPPPRQAIRPPISA
jgi:hypothetical protein